MNVVIISLNPADEIFLSKEVEYFKNHNIVFISRIREQYDNVTINSDGNVKTFIIDDPHATKASLYLHILCSFFKPEVWQEVGYLIKYKKVSILSIKKILYYSAGSAIDAKIITRILQGANISTEEQTVLYSYRMNTGALTILKVKKHYKKAKCIARAHGIDLYEFRQKDNYLPFRRKIMQGLAKLYCISQDGKNYMDKYPFPHCDVDVSTLGTKDYGQGVNCNKKEPKGRFTIVSCSRISPEKRIERIIDALSLVEEDIQWVHIGGGDTYEELKEYACKRLKDKCNVKFDLVGNMENEAVVEYYSNHYIDAFINVSSIEGIPVSIMEASSFGIPVIATNVGGTSEIVEDCYNGYLIPSDFTDKLLASKIISMMNNEVDVAQIRQNARSKWEADYNYENNYQSFSDSVTNL